MSFVFISTYSVVSAFKYFQYEINALNEGIEPHDRLNIEHRQDLDDIALTAAQYTSFSNI